MLQLSAAGACAVYVEQPNAFGELDEGITRLKEIIGENTALIVGVDAVSLGIVEAPGNYGADIVVGEGQPFGIGPTAGGPIYGLFACKKDYLQADAWKNCWENSRRRWKGCFHS